MAVVKASGPEVKLQTDPIAAGADWTPDSGVGFDAPATMTPVLSDPTMAVSEAYHANTYGMMGSSRDGHTFILVGPDGTIRWRADYGGAPRYTMFVAPSQLLGDLRAGESNTP